MIKIRYPDIDEMHGRGQLQLQSLDIWESDTKPDRRAHYRVHGYNVKICCAHYTFAKIHTTTKAELRRAIIMALDQTIKIISRHLKGGHVDYISKKDRALARLFVNDL